MKKFVSLLLTVLLTFTMFTALATESKTTDDLSQVVTVTNANNEVISGLIVDIAEPSVAVQAVLTDITKKVTSGASLVEIFGASVKEDVAAFLPSVDLNTLPLNELNELVVNGYDSAYGEVRIGMQFATVYKDGQQIVAMVLVDGEWIAQAAEVENGIVYILLSQEVLEKVNGIAVAIAILG